MFLNAHKKGRRWTNRAAQLSPDQIRAIGAMSGAEAAELDGLDVEAVVDWMAGDARFVAGLNRTKTHRAEVRSVALEAVAALRELVSGLSQPLGLEHLRPPLWCATASA